jgi:hypothetical protein
MNSKTEIIYADGYNIQVTLPDKATEYKKRIAELKEKIVKAGPVNKNYNKIFNEGGEGYVPESKKELENELEYYQFLLNNLK